MITYITIKLMHQLIHQRMDDFMGKTAEIPRNQIHNLVESVEITGHRSNGFSANRLNHKRSWGRASEGTRQNRNKE
jgi:hypothetical protein